MYQRFFKAVILNARRAAPIIATLGAGATLSMVASSRTSPELGAGGAGEMIKPVTFTYDSVDELTPPFNFFIENLLAKGSSECIPYTDPKGDKPFDVSLVKMLALQAQKTLGRELVEKDNVQNDLFYYPLVFLVHKRTPDDLRDIITLLKRIDDEHMISPKMRSAMLKSPTRVQTIRALYSLAEIHDNFSDLEPASVFNNIPVEYWHKISNALYEMKKNHVDITSDIVSCLQRHPQCAESINQGVVYITALRERAREQTHIVSLANTVLKALLEHTEPNNITFLNGLRANKNQLAKNLWDLYEADFRPSENRLAKELSDLYKADILSPDMAGAIKTAIENEPAGAGRILFALCEAKSNGYLTESVRRAIIENPCELLGEAQVHKVAFGTVDLSSLASGSEHETGRTGPLF